MFDRSLAEKPSGPGLWFVESLLITISISVLEINLQVWTWVYTSIFPGSALGDCTFLRICPIFF